MHGKKKSKMMAKGGAAGGMRKRLSKGGAMGGKKPMMMSGGGRTKGGKAGGKMTLSKIRSAANAMGYKLVKKK